MNIKILFTLLLLFTLPSAYAQKVKMKNDVIYVDGEASFSYAKRTHGTEIVVYTLNTKDELFTAIFYSGDAETRDDNYYRLVFSGEDKSMEYTRPYWNKSLIVWLLEQEVLTGDGKLDASKIDNFISKYDEKVSERTMILH